jgi:hypothetical protein
VRNTAQGLAVLFGGDFFGGHSQPAPGFFGDFAGLNPAVGALHIVGLALAAWALCVALRHCYRTPEFVVAGLAVAVVVVITLYLFSGFSGSFLALREVAGVLPMTAVLAGRLLPDRLAAWMRARPPAGPPRGGQAGRRAPGIQRLAATATAAVLLAAGAGYAANLAYNATRRPAPALYQPVADWLSDHHLSYGLGGYWQANSITLQTLGRVAVRSINLRHGHASIGRWEAQTSWYDPRRHKADFIIESPGKGGLWPAWVTKVFGPAAHVYRVAGSTVMTWHKNLLVELVEGTSLDPGGRQD